MATPSGTPTAPAKKKKRMAKKGKAVQRPVEKKPKRKRAPRTRKGVKRSERSLQPTPDFEAVLALPDRLAEFLRTWWHVSLEEWTFCMDKLREPAEAYEEIRLSKGPGKEPRCINAPCKELKRVQNGILYQFLNHVLVHTLRFETAGSSFLLNAVQHIGRGYVYSVDIVNAFPSVQRSRVRANLKAPLEYQLHQFFGKETFSAEDVEKILEAAVDLLVFKERLPQGAPTSPRLFGIVCLALDREIWQACYSRSTAVQNFRVTAYVDGYHISSNAPIPEELMAETRRLIAERGFLVHKDGDKNRYYSPETGSVPVITGLVITRDGRVTMTPAKVNQLRGWLDGLNKKPGGWNAEQVDQVHGFLGFIEQIYNESLPSALKDVVPASRARLAQARRATPA